MSDVKFYTSSNKMAAFLLTLTKGLLKQLKMHVPSNYLKLKLSRKMYPKPIYSIIMN